MRDCVLLTSVADRGLAKAPVFSHDQLLVSIYTHDKSPRTSRWLLPSFREMIEREAIDRALVRARADVTEGAGARPTFASSG